ncbi:MAG: hypothetical protein J5750_03805 [Clostridiales bacterium]|nr:hypothetical protein [Clostridiales bacterium]
MDRIPRTYENLKGRKINDWDLQQITDLPCDVNDFLVSYYDSFDRDELGLPEENLISEEALTKTIETAYQKFKEVGDAWKKGFIVDEDLISRYSDIFEKYYIDFLDHIDIHMGLQELRRSKEHTLKLKNLPSLTRSDKGMWARFIDDYNLWRSGCSPCSIFGDAWLAHHRYEGPAAGYFSGDEVSTITKERFFRLMDAFCLPPAFYFPCPTDIPIEDTRFQHHPFCLRIGFSIWEDDGGLLKEDIHVGDTVTLTDHYGLKSVIKILDHLTSQEEVDDRRYYEYSYSDNWSLLKCNEGFVGYGHIEGYTSSRDREIDIAILDGKVHSLYTKRGGDDWDAFLYFPLWKESRAYGGFVASKRYRALKSLTLRFIGDEAAVLWRDGKPAYLFASEDAYDTNPK